MATTKRKIDVCEVPADMAGHVNALCYMKYTMSVERPSPPRSLASINFRLAFRPHLTDNVIEIMNLKDVPYEKKLIMVSDLIASDSVAKNTPAALPKPPKRARGARAGKAQASSQAAQAPSQAPPTVRVNAVQ
jgi:hypothetical protein